MFHDCEFPYTIASFLPFWEAHASWRVWKLLQVLGELAADLFISPTEQTGSRGNNTVQLVQTELAWKKIRSNLVPFMCLCWGWCNREIGMQMFCYDLVNNPRMNCMFKHVDLFLTLKWDLVISSFSGMYYYLFSTSTSNHFYYACIPYF